MDDTAGLTPSTLGEVLYSAPWASLVSEESLAALVQCVAAGDPLALHELYERAHRPVFTLALRITGDGAHAQKVTLQVFLDVWQCARSYQPDKGPVLGWIMNQARQRSLEHQRLARQRAGLGAGPIRTRGSKARVPVAKQEARPS
jgi:RNA polymerase sigma-70 factor, ECF subfamily